MTGIKAINRALKAISMARDVFAYEHAEDYDIDWSMEQFKTAIVALEQLVDTYEGGENNV